MTDAPVIIIGTILTIFFIWRFARTRQLYITTIEVIQNKSKPIQFDPHYIHSFYEQGLLGHRSVKPISFFLRALIFIIVFVCLLPFRHYQLTIQWLVGILITLYAIWCIVHGWMLKKFLKRKLQNKKNFDFHLISPPCSMILMELSRP